MSLVEQNVTMTFKFKGQGHRTIATNLNITKYSHGELIFMTGAPTKSTTWNKI